MPPPLGKTQKTFIRIYAGGRASLTIEISVTFWNSVTGVAGKNGCHQVDHITLKVLENGYFRDLVWESTTPPTKILKNFPQQIFFWRLPFSDILGKPLPADSYEFLEYFQTGVDPPPYFGNYLAIFLRKIPLNVCYIFSKRYEKCSKTTPKIYQKH